MQVSVVSTATVASRRLAPLLLALGLLGSGCTAILAPRDDVERCENNGDCTPTGDERYTTQCRYDDPSIGGDEFERVCVAEFRSDVSCDPDSFNDPTKPYRAALDELADFARYGSCEGQQGTLGCGPAAGGTCAAGLVVNDEGVCDDDDPSTPRAVRVDDEVLLGQDVRDQFCRSFFCDDRFVCDSGTHRCVICDDDQPFGEGGCGEVYVDGAPSCVYDDADACAGPEVNADRVTFGCG